MNFVVIDEERKVEHISVNPKDYRPLSKYYYFASQTEDGYRPLIYGVASKPLPVALIDSLKRILNLS
ncbi:MAG: hypothetical protein NT099_09075 [Candidatus Saganbacteria bacterium]|nr:hypothetical protein [Candidatus Saganbacteria bacterium]